MNHRLTLRSMQVTSRLSPGTSLLPHHIFVGSSVGLQLYAACCMLHAACCMLHAACCMLHVVPQRTAESQPDWSRYYSSILLCDGGRGVGRLRASRFSLCASNLTAISSSRMSTKPSSMSLQCAHGVLHVHPQRGCDLRLIRWERKLSAPPNQHCC